MQRGVMNSAARDAMTALRWRLILRCIIADAFYICHCWLLLFADGFLSFDDFDYSMPPAEHAHFRWRELMLPADADAFSPDAADTSWRHAILRFRYYF